MRSLAPSEADRGWLDMIGVCVYGYICTNNISYK